MSLSPCFVRPAGNIVRRLYGCVHEARKAAEMLDRNRTNEAYKGVVICTSFVRRTFLAYKSVQDLKSAFSFKRLRMYANPQKRSSSDSLFVFVRAPSFLGVPT